MILVVLALILLIFVIRVLVDHRRIVKSGKVLVEAVKCRGSVFEEFEGVKVYLECNSKGVSIKNVFKESETLHLIKFEDIKRVWYDSKTLSRDSALNLGYVRKQNVLTRVITVPYVTLYLKDGNYIKFECFDYPNKLVEKINKDIEK